MRLVGSFIAVALTLVLDQPAFARAPVPPAEPAVATPAPGSIGAAAQDDAQLRGLLERVPEADRAHFSAMSLAELDEAMTKPETSRTATDEVIRTTVLETATPGLFARWDESIAGALASIPDDLRAEISAMPMTRLVEIGELPAGQRSTADARLLEAFELAFATAAMAKIPTSHGDVTLDGGLAILHLGDAFDFIGRDGALHILVDEWGNPLPETAPLGMIVPRGTNPMGPNSWAVVVTYREDGHVDDDDAEDIDYDELLEQMRSDDAADNATRRSMGLQELHLVGWAAPPRYDQDTRRLYWARELAVPSTGERVLNYDVRVLGRKGVLSLNAVGDMAQLDAVGESMVTLLGAVELQSGSRYDDFDPDIDELAAYGIGGLIAGKLAMKAGVLAGLFGFLVAAKKAVVVGLVAIGAAIASWFKRRRGEG